MAGYMMATGGLAVGFLVGTFYAGRRSGVKGRWNITLGGRPKEARK